MASGKSVLKTFSEDIQKLRLEGASKEMMMPESMISTANIYLDHSQIWL